MKNKRKITLGFGVLMLFITFNISCAIFAKAYLDDIPPHPCGIIHDAGCIETEANAPELVSFDFDPKTIDVSNGSQDVEFTFRLTDPDGVAKETYFEFKAEDGPNDPFSTTSIQSLYMAKLVHGDKEDGTYKITVNFSEKSAVGRWRPENLFLADSNWNTSTIHGQDAISYFKDRGFPTVLEVKKDSPTSHIPSLSFSSEQGFQTDYINPNKGTTATEFQFKTVYTDPDNDQPMFINLVVDGGQYAFEKDNTSASTLHDGDYRNGEQYVLKKSFNRKDDYDFHIEANDGWNHNIRVPIGSESNFQVNNVPVIIVPGMMGSTLYNEANNKLWLDRGYNTAWPSEQLDLNEDGSSKNKIKVGEAITAFNFVKETDILDGLISHLKNKGYSTEFDDNPVDDLFVFGYDWRLDNSLNTFGDDKNFYNLEKEITGILGITGAEKVDIVAHSMGGLIVERYIAEKGDDSSISRVIFIGTPHIGAPKAFASLVEGVHPITLLDNFKILLRNRIKEFSKNMISTYQLLPNKFYPDQYVKNLAGDWLDHKEISDLIDEKLSGNQESFLENADSFHEKTYMLNMSKLGIQSFNVAGCGSVTIGGISYNNPNDFEIKPVNGDKTVPLISSRTVNSDNYYYVSKASHLELPSSKDVPKLVAAILQRNEDSFSSSNIQKGSFDIWANKTKDFCDVGKGKQISIHSPIELHVYDTNNNHLGPIEDGYIENNIPGSTYDVLGDAKFVYLPEGENYRVEGKATGIGSFDVKIKNMDNLEVISEAYFNKLPIGSLEMKTKIDIADNKVTIDQSGDGEFESTFEPSSVLNADEAKDETAPETSIEISGTKGNNNWYKSDVRATLNATDDNSRILKTEYSLDDGQTWNEYGSSINITNEGTAKVTFYSIDRAGNYEEPKTQEIKIDKTAPEAKISVDLASQDLKIEGVDSLTATELSQSGDKTYLVSDEAGNYIRLNFNKIKEKKRLVQAKLENIEYSDGTKYDQPGNNMLYVWDPSKSILMIQTINVKQDFIVLARFDKKSNKTVVDYREKGDKKQRAEFAGMKVIELSTNKGELRYQP